MPEYKFCPSCSVEVDRLRAEKAELQKRYNDLYDKFREGRDEIERLKK